QKEANIWHFGHYVGLDFNSGSPVVLDVPYFTSNLGNATISDSLGNLLFSCGNNTIWNRNGVVMVNGKDLAGRPGAAQFALILKKPNSNNIYYVFTVSCANEIYYPGFWYSVIDMNLDGGHGAVTNEKNIPLDAAWDARDKQIGLISGNDIKVITYKAYEDEYAVFTLSKYGVDEQAVISPSLHRVFTGISATMKLSYNKKYLVTAFASNDVTSADNAFEICKFDQQTDSIKVMYTIHHYGEGGTLDRWPNSVEFSPDSKLLYLCSYIQESGGERMYLYQYDMKYVEDSALFKDSEIIIAEGEMGGMQLATDGKIYFVAGGYDELDYVSVIHEPWKRGTDCNFEEDAIYMGYEEDGKNIGLFLPNILLDHLLRFEWEGRCSAEPFVFQPNFQPDPVYIRWSFSDPAAGADSISLDLNPVHYFTQGGEYEVKVFVQYPSGRIEETSRVVTVIESPHPDLGPDTLKCELGAITLNAGDEDGMYVWSNGTFGNNARQITVSDSGWYWVQVTNSGGCQVRDSIYVGVYPKAIIDETNLSLIPTSCGGSNGKVLGLAVSGDEPLSFEWFDAGDNLLGTELDLVNLPVGNYYLHIIDGNACTTISNAYTIEDAGDIEIALVEKQDAHCSQNTGSINITAVSGDPANLLYSIDNGANWQTGNPLFENLPTGNYFIRVKDLSGCETVFADNPVLIENLPGPEVSSVNTSPEIDFLQNGEIDIAANANSGQLFYSIDGGNNFQTNNGLFQNLSAGTYFCIVKDDFGCDTAFTVVLTRSITQLIEAIAGNGNTCIGNAAVVPLKLNNFTDIFKFHVKLTYDTTVLTCDGYINVNPQLESSLQASIIPGTNEVIVSWQGETPATLEENATMLELVFGAKKQGISGIDWAALPGESAFYNESLDEVSADYHVGTLRVYTRPKIEMYNSWSSCEGYLFTADPDIIGGTGDISYNWDGPNGFSSTYRSLEIPNIVTSQAGIYTLIVSDTINCSEKDSIKVVVNENPQIAFAGQDTIFAQPGFLLEAGSGYFYYEWNTGENTDAIVINQEGAYSVRIGTKQQCFAADTVTILWGGEPFFLPNAFSPDGDGLNDEFKPVEKYDFVKTYQL
ncbi:MAG TPA: hypothetical protein VIN10_03155, partial [Bacteroidales bacterium]